jgi:hypothetical protein
MIFHLCHLRSPPLSLRCTMFMLHKHGVINAFTVASYHCPRNLIPLDTGVLSLPLKGSEGPRFTRNIIRTHSDMPVRGNKYRSALFYDIGMSLRSAPLFLPLIIAQ